MSHACLRAKERYGCELDRADIKAMEALIACGAAEMVEERKRKGKRSVLAELWLVWCARRSIHMPVVYVPEARKIVTVLPRDCAEVQRFKEKKLRAAS